MSVDETVIVAAGGWCAPSSSLTNLIPSLPPFEPCDGINHRWQPDTCRECGHAQELECEACDARRAITTTDDPDAEPSPDHPRYSVVEQPDSRLYMVIVDEGWRTSILCERMYEWAARWLVDVLQGRPLAPGRRPS